MDLAKKNHNLLKQRNPTKLRAHRHNNNILTANNNICLSSNNSMDSLDNQEATSCHRCNKVSLHNSTSNRFISNKWDSLTHSRNSKCILINNHHKLIPFISKYQFNTKTRMECKYKLKWVCLTILISKWLWVVHWRPNISLRPNQCQLLRNSTVPSASANFTTLLSRTNAWHGLNAIFATRERSKLSHVVRVTTISAIHALKQHLLTDVDIIYLNFSLLFMFKQVWLCIFCKLNELKIKSTFENSCGHLYFLLHGLYHY